MDKLEQLLQLIRDDAQVRRFQELERVIDQNESLQTKYKILLDAQKDMVQAEVKKLPRYESSKNRYESLREELLDHPLMGEYLDLLEAINNDLSLIRTIIEEEINRDLD